MQGRTVDFKNTLIIMTSNVGSSVIEKGGGGLGFQLDASEEDSSYNRIKTLVNEELKQYFRPEFLNRYPPAHLIPCLHLNLPLPSPCIGSASGTRDPLLSCLCMISLSMYDSAHLCDVLASFFINVAADPVTAWPLLMALPVS
jgi:hypothetical protein